MSNKRTEIRDAVIASLLGETSAEDRVYQDLENPLFGKEYPLIVVKTNLPEIRGGSRVIRHHRARDLDIIVELHGVGDETFETLDEIAGEVETALANREDFGASVVYAKLNQTEPDVVNGGEERRRVQRMTYFVTYMDS